MGAGRNVACVTCRKDYYVGYGSYEYQEELVSRLFPAAEHEGHEVVQYTEDYTHLEGDDLMLEGQFDSEVLIKDCGKFEQIDLTKKGGSDGKDSAGR